MLALQLLMMKLMMTCTAANYQQFSFSVCWGNICACCQCAVFAAVLMIVFLLGLLDGQSSIH
jgi:hypothetical protein